MRLLPVSYTHLDVYKRQDKAEVQRVLKPNGYFIVQQNGTANLKEFVSLYMPCLLYTSKQVESTFYSFLSSNDYQTVVNASAFIIQQCCETILKSKRIVLIGSDEMISNALRFQGDFCVMKKMTIKDSIYLERFFVPNEDDFVIIMTKMCIRDSTIGCLSNIRGLS